MRKRTPAQPGEAAARPAVRGRGDVGDRALVDLLPEEEVSAAQIPGFLPAAEADAARPPLASLP